MSVLVQFVVRQFDLLEGNHLLGELLSGERRVRVDVQPAGGAERQIRGCDWSRGGRELPNQRTLATA